jgi:hypothetical protein
VPDAAPGPAAAGEAPPKLPRAAEVARLRAALTDHEGLRIVSVSGPGGVGKSHLVRHVVEAIEAEQRVGDRLLKLSVDGANEQARTDFFALVEGHLARAAPPGATRRDPFPHLRKVAAVHRALVEVASAELDAGEAPAHVKLAALSLLRMGRRLNKLVPKSKELFDAGAAEDTSVDRSLDDAWRMVGSLRALRGSSALPGPVRELLGATTRSRVRTDLHDVTAEALVADLADQSVAPRAQSAPSPRRARRAHVLLVIDDFEALAPTLEEFLVGALVPRLAEAPFASTMIVIGRDELAAMHPAWSQHCRQFLADSVRLAPFARDEALGMLAEAGVPEDRREAMFEAAQGFPFLLRLLADEMTAEGADSALFLRTFFERTTRWLSPRQREWFMRVCYLDAVNVDTLARVFPPDGEDRVDQVQDWFEREASIRDPTAPVFRVRPLIREKVLRYLELRSPSRHRELLERARGA